MGYLIKAIVGLALFLGSIALFNVELVKLLDIGTCASGNTPYAISRPCPEGTGTAILLLTGSIFAGLIGAFLFAVRGDPPWERRRRGLRGAVGFPTVAWGIFFTATGAVSLIAAQTNDTISSGGELGGTIVGITFLVMGVPALVYAAWALIQELGERDERPSMGGQVGAVAAAAALAATLLAAPAEAATTIGQAAPSGTPAGCATACTYMQRTSAAASPSYLVPPGAWTLTSWSVRGGASDGIARLRVFRPASGEDRYLIVDESPTEAVATDGEPSFPASIAVAGGDVVGLTVGSDVPGTYPGEDVDTSWSFSGDPAVADLVGFDTSFPGTPGSGTRVNVAATLEQDTTPPETTITRKPPNRTRKHLHNYSFASDDSHALFDCKLDGHSYRPCLPPHKVQPKIGRHRFRVRATDAAGNVDPTPAKDRFKIVNG